MKLPVVESFFSLQGEGKRIGKPSLFLRLGGVTFLARALIVKPY